VVNYVEKQRFAHPVAAPVVLAVGCAITYNQRQARRIELDWMETEAVTGEPNQSHGAALTL
jgi:protein gp37